MKNSITKLINLIIILILGLALVPTKVQAVNETREAIILEKTNGEKIIYIKDLNSTEFKYALSETNKEENLNYEIAFKDSNGENVALIQTEEAYKYMFLQKSGETLLLELDKINKITEEEIKQVEALTKIIGVETNEANSKVSKTEDGTTVTQTTGKIVIKDEGDYNYQLIEIVDKNQSTAELNKTAVELYEQITKLETATTMYDKLLTEITMRDDYNKLISDAKWNKTDNKEIMQPENSQEGEKYVVLIQEVKDGKEVRNDIQFMTCAREDAQDVEYTNTIETKIIEKKLALPVTGENLALYIIFGIAIVAIIVLIIRMKHKGKENEKTK